MKKVLALFLAVLMVSSAWVFTATAAGTTSGETIIPITDCGSMDGFAKMFTSDDYAGKEFYKVEDGALAFTFDGIATGWPDAGHKGYIIYQYTRPNGTLDASKMKTLCFDLYVNDAAAIQNTKFAIELRDKNSGSDNNEKHLERYTFSALIGKELVDGWNHIEIDINSMVTVGTVDMSKWNYFRLYAADNHGIDGKSTTVKLDNVYMTDREAAVDEVILVSDNYTVTSVANTVFFNKSVELNRSFNISEMTALEFDMTLTNVEVQKYWTFDIELTSSGKCDFQEICLYKTSLDKMAKFSGITLADGTNHFKIPVAKLTSATNGDSTKNADLVGPFNNTKFNYFRMYNNGSASGGCSITLSNVKLTKADVINYEGGSEEIKRVYGSAVFNNSGEWELLNSADGLSGKTTGGAINSSFVFTPQMFAKVSAIDCEIYVDNSALLDLNICFELTSSGTCDRDENSRTTSIKNIFVRADGKELELNTWNSVRINVSSFTESGTGGTSLNHPYANFIRIFNYGAWNTTGSTVFKLRNLWLVGAKTDVPETSEGATEPEAPGVDNLNRFDNGEVVPTTDNPNNKALVFVNAKANTEFLHGQRKTIFSGSTMDVSGADAMFFDLYLENYSDLYSIPFEFEVTSSGRPDTNESHLQSKLSDIFFRLDGEDLRDGWNSVYVPLDSDLWSYGCDWSNVNYIAIYNDKAFTTSAKAMAAIDNLCFATYAAYDNMKEFSSVASVSIESAALQLNRSINVVFYANVHESISEASMLFVLGDKSYNVTGTRTETLNRMKFTLENVQPNQIGESISAQLTAFTYDGKLLTDSVSDYSVAKYCMGMIEAIDSRSVSDSGGIIRNLMCSVLNYGIAAEAYTRVNEGNIKSIIGELNTDTDGLDTTASQHSGVVGDQGECPVKFQFKERESVELSSSGDFVLRVYVKGDLTADMKLIHSTNKGGKEELTPTVVDAGMKKSDTYYYEIKVAPYEINTAHVFYFEGYEDYKVVTSFGTLLNNFDNTFDYGPSPSVKDMVNAVYAYCAAVTRYAYAMN